MYESRTAKIIPFRQFLIRLLRHGGAVLVLVVVSLLIGMLGYVWTAHMGWVDAFLNASMLLGGMGPVGDLPNDGAKIFAGIYALFAGLVFIASASVLGAPIMHRIFHKLHIDEK